MKINFLLLSLLKSGKIIKNNNFPSCKNCIYYKPTNYNDFLSTFNECEKFGEKNIITDKINYNFADSCRSNESKCGMEGNFFEKEKNLHMKMCKHWIIKNKFYIIITNLYLFNFYVLFFIL